MDKIFEEIRTERNYQIGKWGTHNDDETNTPWMWVTYICQYATKWMRGSFTIERQDSDAFRTSMIKTAAIAIAAVESLDRQRKEKGQPFYETN